MAKIPFIPLPRIDIDRERLESPSLVGVLDRVRFELPKNNIDGETDEIAGFLREHLTIGSTDTAAFDVNGLA